MTNTTKPALSASPVGEPALRMCGYCKTWNSKPCGEQCYLQPSDPVWTAPVAQEPVAYRWPKALAIYRADDQWHCDISFAACPTDEELAALHDFLNKNHKHTSPPATPACLGADEIAFFQAVADGYSGKIEHGCLIVENPKADPQSLALGGVSPNLVLDANAILALLSRAGDQK